MSEPTAIIVLTTVTSEEDAERLARDLIDRRFAACVNVIDHVRSFYRWKGNVEDDREKILLIKCTPERLGELENRLLEIHPYETPELVVFATDRVSEAYGSWLVESCR